MHKVKGVLFCTFFFISCSMHIEVSGTTYYVSSAGNDKATGISPSKSWKTITRVNAQVLNPGDSVLFRRGDKWVIEKENDSDGLRIEKYSGKNGLPIVYGAYGTGAKPILTGRQPVSGWNLPESWTKDGENIWHMATNIITNVFSQNNRGRIWLNGKEAQKAESYDAPTEKFPWTHNGRILYVYASSNPASFYSNIESIGVTNFVITCYKDYIIIQNIDLRGTGNVLQLNGANHCIVEYCNIGYDCGGTGLRSMAKGSQSGTNDDIIIRYNTFDTNDHLLDNFSFNNTEDAINIMDGCSNWDIYENKFLDWSHAVLGADQKDKSYTLSNIKFHANYLSGSNVDYSKGFNFNTITDGNNTGNEIYNNYFYNFSIGNQISCGNLKFYNNIIDNIRGCEYRHDRVSNGLSLTGYSGSQIINNEVYNNIIMNCRDYGIILGYSAVYNQKNNRIINNIIINNDEFSGYQIYIDNEPNTLNNVFRNNLVYKSGVTDLIYYGRDADNKYPHTVGEFNKKDGNLGDIIKDNKEGDPLFIGGSPFVYRIKGTESPAFEAGIDVGLSTDHDGYLWSSPPNIGAFSSSGKVPESGVKMIVYPNPAKNVVNIFLEEPSSESYIIKIISFSSLVCGEYQLNTGVQSMEIPLKLKSGKYIVQLNSGHNVLFTELLIIV